MSKINVGINGIGRIGRHLLRLFAKDDDINIKWPELLINEDDEFISQKDLNAKNLKDILSSGEIFK